VKNEGVENHQFKADVIHFYNILTSGLSRAVFRVGPSLMLGDL
jgi:hypothetical protein